jgi:TolB-like protein/DNA-binding winged helix-turn-helix (wHTH) protein
VVAAPAQSRVLRFATFEVDLQAGELRKSGMRQKLTGQPFEILRMLLERPQEIVTREELQQRIWPKDTFVDYDLALRKAIARLREALGDSPESPHFIETIPRRGYRFIAPVSVDGRSGTVAEAETASAPPAAPPARQPWWSRRTLQIGVVLGLGATATALAVLGLMPDRFSRRQTGTPTPEIHSLAVLPLANLSGDPAQEYFSDGMTDALITELAEIGSIRVISRTSSMQYKQTKKSLPEIARELNVDGIVEGTVQRSGDRVRITAQLIHGPSDKHLWADSYERDMRDVFALERDLTLEIVHEIRAQLKPLNEAPLAQSRSVNSKALEAYLQATYYLPVLDAVGVEHRGATEEDRRKAQKYFQQAIDADPTFAPAYVGLALTHIGLWQGSGEDTAIARRAAERALELDPTLSDALRVLGKIKLGSWDWRGMEEEYRKAIEMNPNDALAHQELGESLDAMGRLDEGLKECQIAQQLDPNQDHLADALYDRREFDRSTDVKLMILRNDPDNLYLHHGLYLNYEAKGMYQEAVRELERTWALVGFPEVAANLQHAFAVSGYTGAMREYAKDLEHLQATRQAFAPVNLAGVYATLGNKDRAFYWLEQAYNHRSAGSGIPLWQLKVDPTLDPLHSDPRFKDLVRRIGLPP